MAMTIKKQLQLFLPHTASNNILQCEHCWKQISFIIIDIIIIKLSVQIPSSETSPIISSNDSIRIQHWNNLKNKLLTQLVANLSAYKLLYNALNDPGTIGFAWMNPAIYNNFFISSAYCEQRNINSTQTLA